METKLLSEKALAVIDQYQNFTLGSATCSIPYYNNRHIRARAKLRAQIGKGSPGDIFDEVESIAVLEKIDVNTFDSTSLKKFLVDKNIGIDCSGLAYYILLNPPISFPSSQGLFGKLRSRLRPVENAGVSTFAHEENSKEIKIPEALPGDIITMIGGPEGGERDHILVIHKIEYGNSLPKIIHYTHAIAWPTDGEYGHGVRQGTIEIIDINKPLTEQKWTEADKTGEENYTFSRAKKSVTSLRRLRFL